ncbi:MAG: right-handed parallel beta-helix repeat-containing protein [Planctomycetota bacterium]|jgi:hypothetical protein
MHELAQYQGCNNEHDAGASGRRSSPHRPLAVECPQRADSAHPVPDRHCPLIALRSGQDASVTAEALHPRKKARRDRPLLLGLVLVAAALLLTRPAGAATFNFLTTPVEIGPSNPSTWEDVDVSAWVPAGATGVIIQYEATGSSAKYGVRENGSTDTWMSAENTAYVDTTGFLMTGVDAGRVIEVYEGDTAIKTYLIGYTMEGVTFFTNAIDKSLSTTGSYQDIDISGDTGADTPIGAILTVQNTSGSTTYAIRKNGSTDDHYNELKNSRSTSCLIGVDAGEICELKISSTVIDAYLVGYVTSGAVFFTNGVNKSTGTTGSYVDVDITADLGSDDANGAILQAVSDSSLNFGVRKNGASYDYYGLTKNEWVFTAIDATDVFEQKIETTSKDLFLIGYTLATSPPTIASAANQSFFVGDSATAVSAITVTDGSGLITAANDIRIRIPAGFNMAWVSTDTTASIAGTAAGKVSTTVTYEDSDGTLVLDVTSDFADGDVITVSELGFTSFTNISVADNLELEIYNDGLVTATDDKTIAIGATTYRSIGTDSGILDSIGTASMGSGSTTVTFAGGADLPTDIGRGDVLTIGSGSTTLFSDLFSDGVITGWTEIFADDPLDESEGVLQTTDTANTDCLYTIDAGATWTDYTYSIDVKGNDDDIAGIVFRFVDSNNYYRVRHGFGDSKYINWDITLEKVVGGSATDLAPQVDNSGQVNSETIFYELKVVLAGTSIKVYVDDVLKFDVSDSTFSMGTGGVLLEAMTDTEFDNALVTGAGAAVFHILSRDSVTQVTTQEIAGSTLSNESFTIERAYTTLQAWEDDRQGDLVSEGRREVGVCYNDSAFLGRLVISGSTTDATRFMWLTVAAGQGHNGIKNSGPAIDANGGWGGLNAIDVEDEYTRIEGLEIREIQDLGSAVYFADSPAADGGLVSGVFVHSCWQNSNAGVDIGAQNVTVRNCIFTGGTSSAIRLLTNSTATIENCTLYGEPSSGGGVTDQPGTTVSIKNTIAVNYDTGKAFVLWSGISYFGNNMLAANGATGFDPDAQDGGNQLPPSNLDKLFVSAATSDFHLNPTGHRAGNTGLNLSGFSDDVDGETRTATWDIGADEAVTGTDPLPPTILSWKEMQPQ